LIDACITIRGVMTTTKQSKCKEESRGGIMGRTILEKLKGKVLRVCVKQT